MKQQLHNVPYLARMGEFKKIKKIFLDNPLYPVDEIDHFGKTGFLYAAQYDELDMMKFFIDNGADVDAEDYYGCNALSLAIMNDSENTAKYLIELGVETNMYINGSTLLHIAIHNENAYLSYKLLEYGADPSVPDYRNLDAYQLAQQKLENEEVKKFESILTKYNWI